MYWISIIVSFIIGSYFGLFIYGCLVLSKLADKDIEEHNYCTDDEFEECDDKE